MRTPSFLQHAAVYGIGNVVLQAAGFLLLPLYLRCLDEEQYGQLEVLSRISEVLALCLLCNGLRQTLLTFHGQSQDDRERGAVVGSLLVLLVGAVLLGGGLLIVFAEPLARVLDAGDPDLLRLAQVAIFLEAAALVLLALAQARLQALFYVTLSFAQFLVRVILAIVLVAVCGLGVRGVLLASACSSGVFVAFLILRELLRGGLRVEGKRLRAMIVFALPFVPGGIGFFILNSGDRFFMKQHCSLAEIGAYALGYKLALAVSLVSRSPLYMVWTARLYSIAKRPDAPVLFGVVATRILAAYLFVGLGLAVFADEVIAFIASQGYRGAAVIIPVVVLAYFFLTLADLLDSGFYVQRRTGLKTPIMLASTASMLLLYSLCIPRFGALGAACATLGGFAVHAVLTGFVVRRVFRAHYEWGRLAALLLVTAIVWAASRFLPATCWFLPVKLGLCLLWPLLLWHTGVVSAEEKQYARAWFAGLRGWLQRRGILRGAMDRGGATSPALDG
jgi:O-antigen/teichoic acid export membrane protein